MEPTHSRLSLIFKRIIEALFSRFPFIKRLNANMISGLSLFCSIIVYLLISSKMLTASLITLFLVLLLDAFDGIIARSKGQVSEVGWMVDVSVDRVSQAVIFLALSRVFMLLAILEIGLALYSYKCGKHTSVPIRHFLLLILLFYQGCYFANFQSIIPYLDQILFSW